MRPALARAAAALGLALALAAQAQPRDGAANEDSMANAVGECMADPSCRAAVHKSEREAAAREARWQAKSWDEKLDPWLWIGAAGFGLWWFVFRDKKR